MPAKLDYKTNKLKKIMKKNRLRKYRAWDGKRMIYKSFFDRNWYTEAFNGKCVGAAMPDDIHFLFVTDFIGFTDKNGKEIYEGDIIQTQTGIGQVCFDEQYLHYFVLYKYDGIDALDTGFSLETQVIGNIFENKILLE